MSLPIPIVPIYTVHLPSNGKPVRIRPFLVKEEKILLMAAQSRDINDIITATKQVVSNCLVDSDVNIEELSFFDVDYLLVSLRAKSISEKVEVDYICRTMIGGEECGHRFTVALDVSNSILVKDENITDKIELGNGLGVKMKYPKYTEMKQVLSNESELERKIRLIYHCIDYIYDNSKIYSMKDYSREDFDNFIDNLTDLNYKKLEYWINNLPTYEIKANQTCPKCGTNHNLRYSDMNSFFL